MGISVLQIVGLTEFCHTTKSVPTTIKFKNVLL